MRTKRVIRLGLTAAATVAATGALAAPALAEDAVAVTSLFPQLVVTFDTETPSKLKTSRPIIGMGRGEVVLGLDQRPATGEIYALGTTRRLYKLDPDTGAATPVGTPRPVEGILGVGFDFNPVPDRLRTVTSQDDNDRTNVDTDMTTEDGTLAYKAGDSGAGRNPEITAAAYSNNVAGTTTTTLYDIDSARNVLVRQNPPNDGTLETIGALGTPTTIETGFDISGDTGKAYAILTPSLLSGGSKLYTIDLATGAATLVGSVGNSRLPALFGRYSSLAIVNGTKTGVKSYVKPVGSAYDTEPLLSVGDQVPETSDPSKRYQMVGIPDGLGIHKTSGGLAELFMNHELVKTAVSQPTIGAPAQRGAFVSKYRLAKDGSVLSGERAFDTVFTNDTLVGPAADASNTTPAFARFCSAALFGIADGLTQDIYFANEESTGAATFSGLGGEAVAIVNNEAHALPDLGHFPWEQTIVARGTGSKTVVFGNDDGPAENSQLYLYVGDKNPAATGIIARNGLSGGKLYSLSLDNGALTEAGFTSGSVNGSWKEIPNAGTLTDVQTEAASDANGAIGFDRVEDGALDPDNPGDYYFVTTGGGPANQLGRVYKLEFDPANPLAAPKLTIVVKADDVIAAGGDTALSPDNLDVSSDYLMINEDGTTQSRPVMAAKGRDGSIWRFDVQDDVAAMAASAERVVSLDPPGRDGVPVGPGIWETSGIIDTTSLFGADTWISDVQAHPPTTAPGGVAQTVEDGQLFIMRPHAEAPAG